MKTILITFSILLGTFCAWSQQYKPLFNGKDLSGWTIHGTEKWSVDSGQIIAESGPAKQFGYLATEKKYKNFILDVRYFLDRGNSGIFYHSGIEGVVINGWQIEIGKEHNGGVFESYGRGWLSKLSPAAEKLYKPGEWNYMRVYCNGDKTTVWLNGRQISDVVDQDIGAAEGFIALQIHHGGGVKVRFKDIKIRELR